jgi:glycosyltransferase involved in cell wall biosynthesis
MRVSAIIPTYNRAGSLKRLLESFDSIDWPDAANLEVLVVDNGSTDQTWSLLSAEQAKSRKFSLQILEETKKGKSSALNRGLAAAKGDMILILDDDVVVHPQWLMKHIDSYTATSFDAVQGRVLAGLDPVGRPADPERLREYNIPIIDYGDQFCEIRGLTGTNMSFKREVLEKVGFFDTRLGPGAAGFSEDTEYSTRIRKAGFKIGYTPHAIVYHELSPNRYGREYNRMVEYRKGLSRSIYRRDSILFRVIPDLVANCMRYGLYRLLGKTRKVYKTEGRIVKCWGYLMGKAQGVKSRDTHSEV